MCFSMLFLQKIKPLNCEDEHDNDIILKTEIEEKKLCKVCYSPDIIQSIRCKHKICETCKYKISLYYKGDQCIFCYNTECNKSLMVR